MTSEIAIIGADLVDVVRGRVIRDSLVVVGTDGRIRRAGAAKGVSLPRDVVRVDAGGHALLPGIVDCHAHLALRREWHTGSVRPTASQRAALAREAGRRWVAHGVTTVRDAWGATRELRTAFGSGRYVGPRLQISTGLLRSSSLAFESSPLGSLIGSSPALPTDAANGVHAVRLAARRRIGAGADWVKVRVGGWTMEPDREPLTVEYGVDELRAVVEEARAAGIRGVMAHTQGPESISVSLEAGIRSIEHGDLIDEDTASAMVRTGAVLVVQGPLPGAEMFGKRSQDVLDAYWVRQRACIGVAVRAGVRIVLGSDAEGDTLPHPVIAHLAACGLGPMGALRAATIRGAEHLGLEAELGSIDVGKRADLLLFAGDPLAEPDLWREPQRVTFAMLGGRTIADRRGVTGAAPRRGAVLA